MSCNVAFLRLHRAGHIQLPPPQKPANNHLKTGKRTLLALPLPELSKKAGEHTLQLDLVEKADSALQERYHYEPVLLETFVEKERFQGTCYKAANWVYVGDTKGRGNPDVHHECNLPVKSVWLYPLRKDFRRRLIEG